MVSVRLLLCNSAAAWATQSPILFLQQIVARLNEPSTDWKLLYWNKQVTLKRVYDSIYGFLNFCSIRPQNSCHFAREISLYWWSPVLLFWIQLLCYVEIIRRFTWLAESKPVKQEIRCTVMLPLAKYVLFRLFPRVSATRNDKRHFCVNHVQE